MKIEIKVILFFSNYLPLPLGLGIVFHIHITLVYQIFACQQCQHLYEFIMSKIMFIGNFTAYLLNFGPNSLWASMMWLPYREQ